jgi:ABC-type multidrug transport system ATPase subunit
MDEPTAALGPAETAQVRNLVRQLKDDGIGIFLISHDIHDVFDLSTGSASCTTAGSSQRSTSRRHHGRRPRDDHPGKKPDEVTETELAALELRADARRARAAGQSRERRGAAG